MKDEIKTILLGHVIQGKFPSSSLTDGQELSALDGENNKIAITPAGINLELIKLTFVSMILAYFLLMDAGKTINGANILNEYNADNGIVYAIDKIIFR